MIHAKIIQNKKYLTSETNELIAQYASNIDIQIILDDYFKGYSLQWLVAYDRVMKKTDFLTYDVEKRILTLPEAAFKKSGYIYITLRAIKGDEIIPCYPISFYIDTSGNPNADNSPKAPGWEKIAIKLFEQIYANEYKQPLQDLVNSATDRINALLQKATTDYAQLKSDTDSVLDKLKSDYIKAINDLSDQYNKDKIAMLDNLAKQIQALKDTTTTAIDTMIKNANTDYDNLKQSTKADVDTLKSDAQQSIKSMDDLQADLINKRDSGFFDGDDGALIPSNGFFTLFKREGHLLIRYLKGSSPPPLFIKNGHLIYRKVKEV